MRTLPLTCSDDDIRQLVVEWWELVAAGRFREALDLVPHDDHEVTWTPEYLEETIATHGAGPRAAALYPEDPRWEAGSIFAQPDPQAIIRAIQVDRYEFVENDPTLMGIIHFDDVPLKQKISTMTARFSIKRVGQDRLTLEFMDLHVM
ncbi:MAG TPA: hypothetical protein VGR35_23055 [Tepidisphaeraceae bacterium]|nr:hypothetical protein [Tepidisphaeraceae bacterium]